MRATDFGLNRESARRLYQSGRAAATAFLDGTNNQPAWDFEDCKRRYRTNLGHPDVTAALP